MKLFYRSVLVLLSVGLIACSGSNSNGAASGLAEPQPQLQLTFAEAPVELPGIDANCALDVRYGEAERNLLDICLPESDEPTPLVIFFHGGAFVVGDKADVYDQFAGDIREFLQAGIAFATVNYSFILAEPPYDDEGVLKSLTDSARALQFMRYHFESLNIDPLQVAAYGASAGAGTSLWLGTHDDLADPDNADPVLRESTRLNAVGAIVTQATYNFLRWEEILAPVVQPLVDAGVLQTAEILSTAAALGADGLLFGSTATDSLEELESEAHRPYMENIDMLALMDASDAPIYAWNDNALFEDDLLNLFLHHTLHILALHDRAQEVGLENVMYALDPVFALEDPSGEGHVSFLKRHIQ